MPGLFFHVHLDGLRIGGAPSLAQAVQMIDNHRATTFANMKKAHVIREDWGGGSDVEEVVYRAGLEDGVWVVLFDERGPVPDGPPARPGRRSRLSPLAARATRASQARAGRLAPPG